MILRSINRHVLRLAFPIRSAEVDTLVDSSAEQVQLVALQSLTSAPMSSEAKAYIDAPFRYRAVSRFSDGSFGVLYAANSLVTALKETTFHLARLYADSRAPAMETRRTRLSLQLRGKVVDARRTIDHSVAAAIYDPGDYRIAQRFGAEAREKAQAVHFDSVRNPHGGHCVGMFTPRIVRSAEILREDALIWDGHRFTEHHEIDPL